MHTAANRTASQSLRQSQAPATQLSCVLSSFKRDLAWKSLSSTRVSYTATFRHPLHIAAGPQVFPRCRMWVRAMSTQNHSSACCQQLELPEPTLRSTTFCENQFLQHISEVEWYVPVATRFSQNDEQRQDACFTSGQCTHRQPRGAASIVAETILGTQGQQFPSTSASSCGRALSDTVCSSRTRTSFFSFSMASLSAPFARADTASESAGRAREAIILLSRRACDVLTTVVYTGTRVDNALNGRSLIRKEQICHLQELGID